jgi:hypothetical protein
MHQAKIKKRKEIGSLQVAKIEGRNPSQPKHIPRHEAAAKSHRYPVAAPREGHCQLNKDVCIEHPRGHPVEGEKQCPCRLSRCQSRPYVGEMSKPFVLVFRDVLRFSFALDLKSEIKQELFYNNV